MQAVVLSVLLLEDQSKTRFHHYYLYLLTMHPFQIIDKMELLLTPQGEYMT